jgi:hypothetical protein
MFPSEKRRPDRRPMPVMLATARPSTTPLHILRLQGSRLVDDIASVRRESVGGQREFPRIPVICSP